MTLQPSDPIENEDVLYRILREIKKSPEISQRELSARLGISLGKANFLVRALVRRGLVKMENFKTSGNKKAYLYYLTPEGVEEKTKTTYQFLKRKTREYERLEEEIRRLREEVQEGGLLAAEQDHGENRL